MLNIILIIRRNLATQEEKRYFWFVDYDTIRRTELIHMQNIFRRRALNAVHTT